MEFPFRFPRVVESYGNQNQETSWARGRYVLAEEKHTPWDPAQLAAAERADKTQRDTGDRLSQYWLCHQAVLVALPQIGQKPTLIGTVHFSAL